MPDRRFFKSPEQHSLTDIALAVGGEVRPPPTTVAWLDDIAPLDSAGPSHLTVFTDNRYADALEQTQAAAVITSHALLARVPSRLTTILVGDPRLAFAQAGYLFYPPVPPIPSIAASASVHATAIIGARTQIGHGVVIEEGAEVGEGATIGHNTVIGRGVKLGNQVRVGTNCSISHAVIGDRTEIGSNVTIGSEGFGFVPSPAGLLRMLQVGAVSIGTDVKIGANCAIDRGASGDTEIGDGTVCDNLVHIGHNVKLGRHCVVCGQVGIAGSTTVGDGVMIGGQAGISDHLSVGPGARIAAKSGVIRDVAANEAVGGYPAMPVRVWHRQTAALARTFAAKATTLAKRWPLGLTLLLLVP